MLDFTNHLDEQPAVYATDADVCKIFSEEMHSFYLLSLLLTADHEKAAQCFLRSLDECVDGTGVHLEGARIWARRVILRNSIRMMTPSPEQTEDPAVSNYHENLSTQNSDLYAAIIGIRPFERFVFVMSVLERESEEVCCVLLKCSRWDVMVAREMALGKLAIFNIGSDQVEWSRQTPTLEAAVA